MKNQSSFKNPYKQHIESFRRFNEWEKNRLDTMEENQGLYAVFELYQFIPDNARGREINVEGIMKMRRALACLK